MISGNVSINSQAILRPASNATNVTDAAFASRLVKHGFNADTVTRRIAEMMASDPARAKLFLEVEKDGGEASFQKLLKRLVKLRPPQAQNSTVSGGSSSLPGSDRNVPDGSKPARQGPSNPRPISRPLSIEKGLIPDDLSLNGEFARVGAEYPGFLVEKGNKRGETIYRFRNQHALGPYGPSVKAGSNVELTNCFYPITKGDNLAGSPWQNNQELAKMTGAYMNACDGLGKHFYNGEFDIKIIMRTPGNATVFKLVPHSDGLQFTDFWSNKVQKLSIDGSSTDDYIALMDNGARFESSGDAPLTMRVENRDGQNYFTVKTRSDYSTFKSADNHCDIPLPITEDALGSAKCCTDGENQLQDVKYIYVEPLKQGWFHVRFNVEFSDYSGTNDTGSPFTAFGIDKEQGVISHGRIGNNNRDSKSEPSGYHAQFGISDTSGDSVVVRVRNPRFDHTGRQNPKWPNWVKTVPLPMTGECQASVDKPIVSQEFFESLKPVD